MHVIYEKKIPCTMKLVQCISLFLLKGKHFLKAVSSSYQIFCFCEIKMYIVNLDKYMYLRVLVFCKI